MPDVRLQTASPDATIAFAQGLASILYPGDLITLEGDLGAGKTTFVRGLALGLGIDAGLVSSPTFVVINQYAAQDQSSTIPQLIHVDAYRLTSAEDLDSVGWDALFTPEGRPRQGSIAVIEWPGRIDGAVNEPIAKVSLLSEGDDTRTIAADLPPSWEGREGLDLLLSRPPTRCPTTNAWVAPTSPTYPFASARARDADLFGWLTEKYRSPRDLKPEDVGEGTADDQPFA